MLYYTMDIAMKGANGPTVGSLLLGVALLYVGWANAGVLLPPFACGPAGGAALHVGADFALVYARGCELAAFAHVVFALVTVTGTWAIVDGLVADPQRRHEALTGAEQQSQYRFNEAEFDVE